MYFFSIRKQNECEIKLVSDCCQELCDALSHSVGEGQSAVQVSYIFISENC